MNSIRWGELLDFLETESVGRKVRRDRRVRICTDSRSIGSGDVFWVLKGERFDGHGFVETAFEKGGIAAVVDRKWLDQGFVPSRVYVPVDDTGAAFLKVASRHARRFRIPRIAVAGSNGKTTTKEMVAAVMAAKGECHRTKGNLNNHVGVPMTLLGIGPAHRSAVVEMGTSSPGELEILSRAVLPTCAVLTNIGHEHMEFFKTLQAVRDEELKVVAGLRTGGVLVLNADDPWLQKVRTNARFRVHTYGIRKGQVRPSDLTWDENGCASFRVGRTRFQLAVPGVHNVYNALAAIAVGLSHRIPKAAIAQALSEFRAVEGRMNVIQGQGFRILDDCYNANPPSVRSALSILSNMACTGRRVAVLGDMLELGEESQELHRGIGSYAGEMNLDLLWCVGPLSSDIADEARRKGMAKTRVRHFPSRDALEKALAEEVESGDIVLVKASHGLRLDAIVSRLKTLETVQTLGDRR
ncbi:MAG: UDP-N-acetylmuramoyl-tripeptide--D-alanyl-D-alanine ligase [Fibrobacteria bacterium]|nr:UDP-N-acetylmuramoyl-tripeptide--D-alanyl-D-alanine ligase [Fibrobacteria bacterium]